MRNRIQLRRIPGAEALKMLAAASICEQYRAERETP